jgi:hypothetical protein
MDKPVAEWQQFSIVVFRLLIVINIFVANREKQRNWRA